MIMKGDDYMSYSEYNDMFIKCQNSGKFHIFTFDIVNSQNLDNNIRNKAQKELIMLSKLLYEEIQKIEKKNNIKILLDMKELDSKIVINNEPFIFGDMFGFTVYRNTIEYDQVFEIFNRLLNINNIKTSYHVSDGYYETNNYEEGNKLYYRGYCIQMVSNLHKEENNKIKKH